MFVATFFRGAIWGETKNKWLVLCVWPVGPKKTLGVNMSVVLYNLFIVLFFCCHLFILLRVLG